jgi:glycerophosphoryl diester phosphodiesterase
LIEKRPLLLGHRGARREAPENSLAALELALAHGCDGFEFDVRATADGRSILCHNPTLFRRSVRRSTYARLITAAARKRQPPRPDYEVIACLEDVVARFASRAFLDIEIKVEGVERAVVAALRSTPRNRLVVSSFLSEVVLELRSLDPQLPLGWICDRSRLLPKWRELPCETVIAHHRICDDALVAAIHEAGKRVFVWTVNRQSAMLRFARMGVDAIISDDTRRLGHVFHRL